MTAMSAHMDDPAATKRRLSSVLLMAATRWEARPLAKILGLSAQTAGRWVGRVGPRAVTLAQTGIGESATSATLERDFVAGDFGLALSVGLCGAMQPDLRSGDVIADPHDAEIDLVEPLRRVAQNSTVRFHFGRMFRAQTVMDPESKRRTGAEMRAVACDMETAALRRWAAERTPVIAVRVVLDELDDALPQFAPAGDDFASLARYALTHACDLASLIRAGWRTSRGMNVLAQFLKAYLEAL